MGIRQWSASTQVRKNITCRQLLAIKDGGDETHDMNNNDEWQPKWHAHYFVITGFNN